MIVFILHLCPEPAGQVVADHRLLCDSGVKLIMHDFLTQVPLEIYTSLSSTYGWTCFLPLHHWEPWLFWILCPRSPICRMWCALVCVNTRLQEDYYGHLQIHVFVQITSLNPLRPTHTHTYIHAITQHKFISQRFYIDHCSNIYLQHIHPKLPLNAYLLRCPL